jgi:hypothetical protein
MACGVVPWGVCVWPGAWFCGAVSGDVVSREGAVIVAPPWMWTDWSSWFWFGLG